MFIFIDFIEESSLWINLQKKLDTYLELLKEETVVQSSSLIVHVTFEYAKTQTTQSTDRAD